MRLNISSAVVGFGILMIVGLLAVIGAGGGALYMLRVGGPVYDQVILSKDLVADILPPPLYVVEAYLEANKAREEPQAFARHASKLKALHKDYDDRRAYWQAAALPENIKKQLMVDSDAPAQKFWEEVEKSLIPMLERGNAAASGESLGRISGYYAEHRKAVDQIVTDVNAFSENTEKSAEGSTKLFTAITMTTSILVLMLVGAAVIFMRKLVAQPLRQLSEYMKALNDANHSATVPFQRRADELGDMARAVETFRIAIEDRISLRAKNADQERRQQEAQKLEDAARQKQEEERLFVIEALATSMKQLSAGDLVARINQKFPEAFERLRGDFNAAADAMQNALRQVGENGSAIATGAAEIRFAADDLSRRTEQQAASLEETAAALAEITSNVNDSAKRAKEAGDIVGKAKTNAEMSGEIVHRAVAAMGLIKSSSDQISNIIGVIDEIAFQTNLLALNAGVEAARAGEAGRGFSVVASEVRALAQRAAEAAKEIKSLITQSGVQVESGVNLVGGTGEVLTEIVAEMQTIFDSVASIVASSQQQAVSLHEVNAAIDSIDQNTQKNAAMVEETTAASHSLGGQVESLTNLLGRFRLGEGRHAASMTRRTADSDVRLAQSASDAPRRRPQTSGALALAQAEPQADWTEF